MDDSQEDEVDLDTDAKAGPPTKKVLQLLAQQEAAKYPLQHKAKLSTNCKKCNKPLNAENKCKKCDYNIYEKNVNTAQEMQKKIKQQFTALTTLRNKVDQLVTDLQQIAAQEEYKEQIISKMWNNTKDLLGGYYWLLIKDLKVNIGGNITDYCVAKVGLTHQAFHTRITMLKNIFGNCNFTVEVIKKQSIFGPSESDEAKIRKKCGITFQPSDIGFNYNTNNINNPYFVEHPKIKCAYQVGFLFGIPARELANKLPATEFVVMKKSEIPKLQAFLDKADESIDKTKISEFIVDYLDLDINVSPGTTITVSWESGIPGNFSFVSQ